MEEWFRLIVPGLVGAFSGILTLIVRDIIIEKRKEKRQERIKFLDRQLSDLYAPCWVALGGGKFTITNLLNNEQVYPQFVKNFHLFSPALQAFASEYLGSVGKRDPRDELSADLGKAAELSHKFGLQLEKEIASLREEYLRLVGAS